VSGDLSIPMMEATDLTNRNHTSVFRWIDITSEWRIAIERRVDSRLVVGAGAARQDATQVIVAEEDHVIEALATDRADHALGVGVLPRRTRRDQDVVDAHDLDLVRERAPEDAAAIAGEEAGLRIVISEG
jgi:hypothetical protein